MQRDAPHTSSVLAHSDVGVLPQSSGYVPSLQGGLDHIFLFDKVDVLFCDIVGHGATICTISMKMPPFLSIAGSEE